MDHNETFKKMKSLLQNAYNNGRVNRRRDNFTIVPQKVETQNSEPIVYFDRTDELEKPSILNPDENSFLSLDAFDFAEEGLDLESSRWFIY